MTQLPIPLHLLPTWQHQCHQMAPQIIIHTRQKQHTCSTSMPTCQHIINWQPYLPLLPTHCWIQEHDSYLANLKLAHNPFLNAFLPQHQVHRLCTFMHAVWKGRFSCTTEPLKASTSWETLDYMAQKFKASFHPDLRSDITGSISILIAHQTKGYKNYDPSVKHVKALPCSFYQFLHSSAVSQCDKGVNFHFFAMWSCEYTNTTTNHCTKTLTIGNFCFFHGCSHLQLQDLNLYLAFTISKNLPTASWVAWSTLPVSSPSQMKMQTLRTHALGAMLPMPPPTLTKLATWTIT